jgi:hypothetical protein
LQIFALGVVSVFDQVLCDMESGNRQELFDAYISALSEDAEDYRKDAAQVTEWAQECSSPEELKPDASGFKVRCD